MASNYTFLLQANFIDLDVKPLDKMEHYFKLDQKIVNFYSRNEIVPSLKSSTKDASLIPLQQ
jgi:inositol-pentakisphosphate 2-kinase